MPQLSLYIDEDTLRKLETGAKINNTSVSKFVVSSLKEHFAKSWPEGFQNIFGSVKDDSFEIPNNFALPADAKRENL